MKIYCIIPARGGSKGVPGKNIRSFLNRPLIEHSIAYARESRRVDRVFVSTDDKQIADISSASGAEIITRPAAISGDTATTETAIEHALQVWRKNRELPEIIVLLQATSPLRPSRSLDKALEHFTANGYDSLLSISPTHRFFWKISNGEARAEYDYLNRPRRQDLTAENIRYVENGSLYIFTTKHFEKTSNRLGGRIGYTIFPEEYSPEIDTLSDFTLLEKLALDLGYQLPGQHVEQQ